jgi:heavy metal sensor kinase
MNPFFSTLRFKITLLQVVIFGVALLSFSAILYWVYQRDQAADFDTFLYNRAMGVSRSISINSLGQIEIDQTRIAESEKLVPFQYGNEYIEVRTLQGKSLAHTKNMGVRSFPLAPNTLNLLKQGQFIVMTIPPSQETPSFWGHGNLRLLSLPLVSQGRAELILQLGVSTHAYDASLARLRTTLFFIGIPLTLLFSGVAGWWVSGRAFLPINRIMAAAQNLGAERLEQRLPVPKADDELRRLSLTLNAMLDRLADAFKSQQRFVADASHELKTPLTILKGEVDVLRQQPRTVEEYQDFLTSASEELERVSQIMQNLLLLARADSGRPIRMEKVRLDEIVLGMVERLQSFAKQGQVQISVKMDQSISAAPDALLVNGDTDLLGSLFFNLVHNAIKYSAAGQTVEIKFETSDQQTRVSIRDFGTGIRPEELAHIFERFHRAENPKHGEVTGTGLGLAIARWIAEAHNAKISAESKPAEGSKFTVVFQQGRT